MRDFRKLQVWRQAVELVTKIYEISAQLPDTEKYGLRSQIQRAAVSIPSNIAEGASRHSESEFRYFLEIAIGSTFELETQMILAKNLRMLSEEKLKAASNLIESIEREEKMLNSLISKLTISKRQQQIAKSK